MEFLYNKVMKFKIIATKFGVLMQQTFETKSLKFNFHLKLKIGTLNQ